MILWGKSQLIQKALPKNGILLPNFVGFFSNQNSYKPVPVTMPHFKQGSFKRYVEAYYPQGYHGVNCKEGISFYHNHIDVFSEIWVGGSCFKRITCNRISWVLVPNYNKGRIRIEPIHLRQGSTCVIRDGQRKVMSLNYNPW